MLTLLFAVATVFFAVKWLSQKIAVLSVLWYFEEKGAKMPSDAELKRCVNHVVENMVKDITGRK